MTFMSLEMINTLNSNMGVQYTKTSIKSLLIQRLVVTFYPPPLNNSLLQQHLEGSSSYGVFSTSYTKFIVFDFDFENSTVECKWYYYKIYFTLINVGIPEENLYTFFSGNKGIHLTIYFDNPIHISDALLLYNTVLIDADSINMRQK